ncbi:zinc metalloprotease HtpX [Methanobacterium movens]
MEENTKMKKFSTWKLKLRLIFATFLLFALVYALVVLVGSFLGISGPLFYVGFGLAIVVIQYLVSPKMVELTMKVRYVSPEEAPQLHQMVEELSRNAGIPKPKVGITEIAVPNAFAFGRSKGDGRVCVTRGIINLLDRDELYAVLGHEISHIRHSDMAVMTVISAIPLICYYIFWSTLFSRNDNNNGAALIGVAALVAYLIGQLLVLFVSRVREYYADEGSVEIGAQPHKMASALYKLVYGSANLNKDQLKEVEGVKAFFVNDVSDARNEINDLRQVDFNRDGIISQDELNQLKYSDVNIKTSSKLFELISTHPNMVKRIKRLADMN